MQSDPTCKYCRKEAKYQIPGTKDFFCHKDCLVKTYKIENTLRCPFYIASCNQYVLEENFKSTQNVNRLIGNKLDQKIQLLDKDVVNKQLSNTRQSLMNKCLQKKKELTWEEFSGPLDNYSYQNQLETQKKNENSVVLLKQKDFDRGQLRVHANCILKLGENIQFNPNKIDDWKPLQKQQSDFDTIYGGEAFALDFFAAISLENTANVIIDLNRYSLSQHTEHALQQRFISLIEISDQPFMPTEGPGNFGSSLDKISNVFIENGKLGLTSHHCIHSNQSSNILIQNIEFSDYEVAAISMNEPQNLIVKDCKFLGNRRDVPVNAQYSAARFLQKFGNYVLQTEINDEKKKTKLQKTLSDLLLPMDKTFSVIQYKLDRKEIPELFRNESGILDGSAYAILIHSRGVAVNKFQEVETKGQNSARNVFFENLDIRNTDSDVKELITLYDEKRQKPIIDIAGALFNIQVLLNKDGTYKSNLVSDVQIALADYILSNEDLRRDPKLQVMTINQDIIDWTRSKQPIYDYLLKNKRYSMKRDSDSMFHVNRGTVAIRLCNTENALLNNVIIKNTNAIGSHGSFQTLPSEQPSIKNSNTIVYKDSKDGGHPLQGKMIGYCGADSRGISISACDKVVLKNVEIDTIRAEEGSAIAIDLMNNSTNVEFQGKCNIKNIHGLLNVKQILAVQSLKQPESVGLNIGNGCVCFGVEKNLKVEDSIHCGNFCSSKIQIN